MLHTHKTTLPTGWKHQNHTNHQRQPSTDTNKRINTISNTQTHKQPACPDRSTQPQTTTQETTSPRGNTRIQIMSKIPTLRSLNMIEYRKSPRFEYAPMDISRYTRRSALQPPRIRAQAPQRSQEPQAQPQETTEQPAPAKPSSPAPSNEGVYEGLSDLVPDVLAMDRFLDSSSTSSTTNTPQATPSPAPSETQSTKQKPKEEASNGLGQPAEEQSQNTQQPSAEQATSVDESDEGGYYMLSAAAAYARLAIPEVDEEENELIIKSALK